MMSRRAQSSHRTFVPWTVVVPFALSGILHLVRPGIFTPIIPRPLRRWGSGLVVASGIAELVCATGLVLPTTRERAGRASALVLAAVWPANIQMSIDLGRRATRRRDARSWVAFAASLARLPLQLTLIRQALRAR